MPLEEKDTLKKDQGTESDSNFAMADVFDLVVVRARELALALALDRTLADDRDPAAALALAHALVEALALAHALARARDPVAALARARDPVAIRALARFFVLALARDPAAALDRTLAGAYARDLEYFFTLARAFARDSTDALARERFFTLARDLDLDPARARDLARDPVATLSDAAAVADALALAVADADASALALARDLALDLALDLDLDLAPARDLALDPARDRDLIHAILFVLNVLLPDDFAPDIDPDKALAFIIENYEVDKATINFFKGIGRISTTVVFKLEDQTNPHITLTPDYVTGVVMPYIQAMARLQNIIDEARRIPSKEIQINFIAQGSVGISMNGVGEVLKFIRELVSPWRKAHAKMTAQLIEKTMQTDIEVKKAEALQIRANAQKTRMEAKEANLAYDNAKARAEKLKLENEELRLEVHEKKIRLALDLIERLEIQLTEEQKNGLVINVLGPLSEIVESPLQLVALEKANGEDSKDGEETND